MNPYESPTTECGDASAAKEVDAPRCAWLVRISLLLAIICELTPMEADMLFMAIRTRDISQVIAIKLGFLTIVLAPLIVYIGLNGWRGLRFVAGRASAIAIIVSVILALQVAGIVADVRH